MMRTLRLLPLVLALHAGALHAQDAPAQRPEVTQSAAALQQKVVTWRRDLHQHPELGNREFRTAALVAKHLRALGLSDVRTGVAHTGVTAVLKGGKPGPRIALRADMDGLPVTEETGLPFASKVKSTYNGDTVGVMHACGHDAHVAILMGVAEALAGMRKDLAGEVLFVFQPAEEGPPNGETGGAEQMLKEGIFDSFKPDAVLGLHVFSSLPSNVIGVREGTVMAGADMFRMVVTGRQAHGSTPWLAVDPIVTASQIVTSAQTVVSRSLELTKQPAVVTFGAFRGGNRGNIIPESVELLGTIRTFDDGMHGQARERLAQIARGVADANGAQVEVQIPHGVAYPVTFNNVELTRQLRPSLEAAAGQANVVTVPINPGGEDFSYLAQRVPGMFFFLGATAPGQDPGKAATNHSSLFTVDEAALDLGLRAMLQSTLDFLSR